MTVSGQKASAVTKNRTIREDLPCQCAGHACTMNRYLYAMALAAGVAAIFTGCRLEDSSMLPEPQLMAVEQLHPSIKTIYEDLDERLPCDAPKSCGSIVRLRCVPELDGPLSFYDNFTGESIMYCGGACMISNPQNPKSCKQCPPPEWQCLYM